MPYSPQTRPRSSGAAHGPDLSDFTLGDAWHGVKRGLVAAPLFPLDLMEMAGDWAGKAQSLRTITSDDVNDMLGLERRGTSGEMIGEFLAPVPGLSAATTTAKGAGKLYQKALRKPEVERQQTYYHRSNKPDLEEIDPAYHGTGMPMQVSERNLTANNPPVFGYAGDLPASQVESGVGPHGYNLHVPEHKIYDLDADPMKLKQRQQVGTKGYDFETKKGTPIYGGTDMAKTEQRILDQGYDGYRVSGDPAIPYEQGQLRYFNKAKAQPADQQGQFSFDVMPGPDSGVLPELNNAPMRVKKQYTDDVNSALFAEGNPILDALRIPYKKRIEGESFWKDDATYGNQYVLSLRRDQIPKAKLDEASAAHGRLFDQDAVAYHKPKYGVPVEESVGVEVLGNYTPKEVAKITKGIKARNSSDLSPVVTPDGVRFLNLEGVPPKAFYNDVEMAIRGASDKKSKINHFGWDSGYVDKGDYDNLLSTETTALVDELRKKLEPVQADFAAKKGMYGTR